jgi:hypothetical protein
MILQSSLYPDMFRHHNAHFEEYTTILKLNEVNLFTFTNPIVFRIFCCWEKGYLIYFRTHDFIIIY